MHQLVAQGVPYAFTNTGSAEAGFFNALLTVPGVQPILLLAESLVLSAADGYAKASRKPAFVNVHLAAGTRQGSGQLQNAYFDGTPMVVTAAMRDVGSFGDHGALGSSGGFSQMGAVEDITKRRWEVWDARGIPTVTRRAFKEAMTFPTGPVYVAYASSGAGEPPTSRAVIQAADAPHMGLVPEAGVIQSIWDALLNAEKPLLVCGQDIGVAGRGEEILDAGRAARAARGHRASSTTRASPCITRTTSAQVENVSEEEYDVVCCVGYRQNTRGYPDGPALRQGRHHHRHRPRSVDAGQHVPARHRRCGATCATRCARSTACGRRPTAEQPHVERRATELRARGEQRLREQARRGGGDTARSGRSTQTSSRISPPGRCPRAPWWSRRTSGTPITCMPFGLDKDRWSLIRTYGGSLGHGIGAAVGAQLGAPDRPVVCSLGDGAVMYSASGFWTMARYSLPILTLVWNNLNYQTVRTNFDTFGGEMAKQQKYPEVYLGDPEIDFVMLAKSQGIEGRKVTEPKELEAALRRGADAMKAGEPYLLDVRVATVGAGADSTWHQRFKLRR